VRKTHQNSPKIQEITRKKMDTGKYRKTTKIQEFAGNTGMVIAP